MKTIDPMEQAMTNPTTGSTLPSSPASVSSLPMFDQHRVLIYTTCYNVIDGVTLTIRKLEQEILASGGHVCILTTRSGNIANTHLEGEHPNRTVIFIDNTVPIPFVNDPNNVDAYHIGFYLSSAVKTQVDDFEPSIIHITVPDFTGLHLVEYARTKEIPLMATYHSNIVDYMDHYSGLGWLKPVLQYFFMHQYSFMQALYVPTPYIRKHLCEKFKWDRISNLEVWGRGVDTEKFSPRNRSCIFRQKLGIDDTDCVITFVGRVVPEKRPDIFANVVRRLHARNIPFHALVIGTGPREEEMKSLPNTTCLGWLSGNELATAYASSDVFLFPSAVETFGNATLEAAASGLPLVVEAGCSGHLVKHGVNGYACKAGNEDSFYKATVNLIVDHERRAEFALQSRELSLSFEKSYVTRQMLANYSRVTDEFYTQYGGRHRNRYNMHRNLYSFLGGTYPHPCLLVLLEYVFIFLFRVIFYMTSGMNWFKDIILVYSYFRMQDRASLHSFADSSSTAGTHEPKKADVLASIGKNSQIEFVGGDFTGFGDCPGQLEAIEEGLGSGSISKAPSVAETDIDESADVVSHCTLTNGCSRTSSSISWCAHYCSVSLSTVFVLIVILICRIESIVRSFFWDCISCGTDSIWRTRTAVQRKRKNSSTPLRERRLSEGSECSMSSTDLDLKPSRRTKSRISSPSSV